MEFQGVCLKTDSEEWKFSMCCLTDSLLDLMKKKYFEDVRNNLDTLMS